MSTGPGIPTVPADLINVLQRVSSLQIVGNNLKLVSYYNCRCLLPSANRDLSRPYAPLLPKEFGEAIMICKNKGIL